MEGPRRQHGRRRLGILLAALAAALLPAAVALPEETDARPRASHRALPCAGTDARPGDATPAALADATLCLLNEERGRRGLRALTEHRRLARAAEGHAGDMVAHQYFAHAGRTGTRPSDRIRATGYLSAATRWMVGENLAWGTGELATPRAIVAAWMGSPGHRANVLQREYRQIGLAVVAGNPDRPDGLGATYVTTFGAVARAR